MEILVAKSYQGLPIVEEPYVKSGKTYCKVKTKSGSVKEVRTYTQKEYDKMYPEYGFSSHKGYGTDQHYQAIRQHGITPIHRKSFLKNIL